MVRKEISPDEMSKEAFWETALWCVTFTHRVTSVFRGSLCQPYFCGIWEQLLRIPLKATGPKEISSDKKENEAFWEKSLCSVKSSHRVTAFPSRSLSLRQFLWNWQSDILEARRRLWWKRKYPKMKSGKKLSEKLLSVLLIHPTELHLYFVDLFASLISVECENRYFGSLWRL